MHTQLFKSILIFSLMFFMSSGLTGQVTKAGSPHPHISCPEVWWSLSHPFIAPKAFRISKEALKITQQLVRDQVLINDRQGGQLDAFKHAYWMGRSTHEMNESKALKLGIAHEKGNYRLYRKNLRKGRPTLHDAANQQMDLLNNESGAKLAIAFPDATAEEFREIVIDHIQAGRLKIIKKNHRGEYLNEGNHVLSADSLRGKWKNAKCLVPSDYIYGEEIYKDLH